MLKRIEWFKSLNGNTPATIMPGISGRGGMTVRPALPMDRSSVNTPPQPGSEQTACIRHSKLYAHSLAGLCRLARLQ